MYPIFDTPEPEQEGTGPRSRNTISFELHSRAFHLVSQLAPVHVLPQFAGDNKGKAHALHGHLALQAANHGFEAKSGQTLMGAVSMGTTTCELVKVGLGERDKFDLEQWRSALASACKAIGSLKVEAVSLSLPVGITGRGGVLRGTPLRQLGRETARVITTELHERLHYKTEKGGHKLSKRIGKVILCCDELTEMQRGQFHRGLIEGAKLGDAVNFARDLGDMPANFCTPDHMAEVAKRIGRDFPDTVKVTVLGREEARKKGMNKFLAVAAGSAEEPKVAIVEYTPAKFAKDSPVLGYVGKTVTFDTGGVDLKPPAGMREMQFDMCGGADVLAAIRCIAALGLQIRVKALIGATTNRTGDGAYLPGDVIPAGIYPLSVLVDNTDAEGRLTLVDVISAARQDYGVTHLVDYATLTGAVITALGDACAGVMTNNQAWCDKYLAAAKAAGEDAHQLPILPKHKKQNECARADVKNTGGTKAGCITAGDFVLRAAFDTPAVHVDIAGTGFDGGFASGWGVLTLVKLAEMVADGK